VSFQILYPAAKATNIKPLAPTLTYDSAYSGLSYAVLIDGKKVVITEQLTPDIFSQTGVYAFKLNQANQYDSFSTTAGSVKLTKPSGLQGQTVAWLNAHGTLTLAHAFNTLSENEWKMLFNNLQTVQ
jgi:hypothetical protein